MRSPTYISGGSIWNRAPFLTVFEIFNIFICMENPIPTPHFWGFGGERPPKCCAKKSDPEKIHVYANPRVLSHFAPIDRPPRLGWARVGNKKVHTNLYSPPRWSATANAKWTKLGRVGLWSNVITPTTFKSIAWKLWVWWGAPMYAWTGSPITPVGFNTAARLCCLIVIKPRAVDRLSAALIKPRITYIWADVNNSQSTDLQYY